MLSRVAGCRPNKLLALDRGSNSTRFLDFDWMVGAPSVRAACTLTKFKLYVPRLAEMKFEQKRGAKLDVDFPPSE